ncbi:uncharacterized protein [Parasteatoda tepidariorum]|uniref:uncharacterized protein n=1 Tax=Parasteatoda tepidariorum TaxID=114398 RepID=UPI001C722BB9|nr:uncharacterized protein LOC107449034 [Parasteatoda tepidariorum]
MCRYLFNRKFYSCLYRAYVESAREDCTVIKYKPALCWTIYYIVFFLIIPSLDVYYFYEYGLGKLWPVCALTLVTAAGIFVSTLNELLKRAIKMLNAMDTIETPASSDASDIESAIAAYQSEQFMNWFYKGPHLEPWPHSRITQSEDRQALRNLRQNNKKFRRNYEKLCSQQSPDSAVSETSFIESEQDSYDESNLLPQAEHRSLHPSRSSEEHTKVTLRSRHPSGSLKEHAGLTLRSRHPSGSLEEHAGLTLRSHHPSGSLEEHAGLTIRSRHPSGSLEEHAELTHSLNPSISSEEQAISSTFVTVAEVHRSNYEESD